MSLYDLPLILADKHASFWFPPKASTFAEETDSLYMAILYISIVFFVLIVAAMVYCMIAFRKRPGYQGDSKALHNNVLEITWTVIPTLVVIWIFARGVYGYMDMMRPPANTLDINVTARKWDWSFQYPNGAISDQLHVPIDRAIRLRMRSEDVLHAFYVPAFRAKSDVVPGRVTTLWFQPILEGSYDLFCAEYCGDQHSEMIKKQGVVVHDQAGYDKWVGEAALPPTNPVAHGYWLYSRLGCKSCHSVEENVKIVGPWFAKSYGTTLKNSVGASVVFDENYVRESVLEPQKQFREGYQSASQMPSFQGKLKEDEIAAITAFLQAMTKDDFLAAVKDGELSKDDAAALGLADSSAAGDAETSDAETSDAETSGAKTDEAVKPSAAAGETSAPAATNGN